MKKISLFLLCIAPLALTSCSLDDLMFWKKNSEAEQQEETKNSNENQNTSNDNENNQNQTSNNENNNQQNGDNTSTTTNPEDEDGDAKILRIYFSKDYLSVKANKTISATVDFVYADGYDWDNAEDELEWSTSDSSIATVSKYGVVQGVSKGQAILTAHTKVSNLTAKIKIFVIESESDIEKSWKKMTKDDHIEEKDTIIIACPQEGKAATGVDTGHKLHSTDVTFSNDKSEITDLNGAAKFYVYSDYKDRGGYNVELLDGDKGQFLHASNTANVWFFNTAKASSSRWNIYWNNSENCWDMRPASNVDGWMMYNSQHQKFTTYENGVSEVLHLVDIYRMTVIVSL